MLCINCDEIRKNLNPAYVFVDGVMVDNCFFADEDTGIALVYAIDERHPYKLKVLPNGRHEAHVLEGDVKIIRNEAVRMGQSRYDKPPDPPKPPANKVLGEGQLPPQPPQPSKLGRRR